MSTGAYVPTGSENNEESVPMKPPKTKYDKNMVVFDRDSVEKVTKEATAESVLDKRPDLKVLFNN